MNGSKQHLDILKEIVQEELKDREASVVATQTREILPWQEWISSRYYSGPFSAKLYDFWRVEAEDFLDTGYNEWVITGGIGTGKTTCSEAVFAYKLYYFSCWDYPQRLFGLADVSKIFFAYLSVTQTQARLTGLSELRDYLDNIPYFQKECKRNTKLDSMIVFPKNNVWVVSGSNSQNVISTNLFGVFLDETNFYKSGGASNPGDIEKARHTYAETTSRRRSRFQQNGVDYSFSLLVSSATDDTSFTEQRMKQAHELKENQKTTVARLWETKKKGTYSSKNFFVFVGNDRRDPFIINNIVDYIDVFGAFQEYKDDYLPYISNEDESVEHVFGRLPEYIKRFILPVPVDFLQDFQRDIFGALMNLGGYSVAPTGKLFSNNTVWQQSLEVAQEPNGLRHPFTKESLNITIQTKETVDFFFQPEVLFTPDKQFRRYPYEKRYVHIDQSFSKDHTGIAMVHPAGFKDDERTGLSLPVVEMDFVIEIQNTKPPDKISLPKILNFIFHLRNNWGVNFGKVSFDQFQSEYQLQVLSMQHINSGRTSVDIDDSAWLDFIQLLDDGRFQQYYYDPFKKEFFNLIHYTAKHKVNHTEGYNKDCSDAVIGAVKDCLEDIGSAGYDFHSISNDIVNTGASDTVSIEDLEITGFAHIEDSLNDESAWVLSDFERRKGAKVVSIQKNFDRRN